MTEPRKRSTDNDSVVIVHDRDRGGSLYALMGAILIVALIAMGVGGIKLNDAINDIERLEADNTAGDRRTAAQLCERGNYTRAELHVAYSMPTPDLPKSQLDKARDQEPLLVAILERNSSKTIAQSLKRVQTLNPILICTPTLRGSPAKAMTPREQAEFVKRYRELKLDPLPQFAPPR